MSSKTMGGKKQKSKKETMVGGGEMFRGGVCLTNRGNSCAEYGPKW